MRTLVARAPTRIDFGGGWTDVPPYSDERGGVVCNAAIELYASARLSDHQPSRHREDRPADDRLARAALARSGLEGVDLTIEADYPVGAGLGGSSAAGVVALGAIATWQGETPDAAVLAEGSRALEVEDLGIAGGRQDHYAAAFGGMLELRFGESTAVRRLGTDDIARRLADHCVIAYTGQSRISGDTITAVLDAYRKREPRVLDALDRMRDLAAEMATALDAGDLESLGALVGEHWVYQRALHPAIPTPLIDRLLELARGAGALGGKALGASGGGCVLAIAPPDRTDAVRSALSPLARLLGMRVAHRGFHVEHDTTHPHEPGDQYP